MGRVRLRRLSIMVAVASLGSFAILRELFECMINSRFWIVALGLVKGF